MEKNSADFSNHMCQQGFLPGKKCVAKKKGEVQINELGGTWWIPEEDDWPLIEEETPTLCHTAHVWDNAGQIRLQDVTRETQGVMEYHGV